VARHASKTCDNPDSEADDADEAEVLSDYGRILESSVSTCNAGVLCSLGNEDWLS
jgi:hypothetical protein